MTGVILDLIVAVLVIVLLLFGIWRGFYKLIFGFVSSLLAIVLAVVFVTSATQLVIDNTTWDESLQTVVDEKIRDKIPGYGVTLKLYDIDGNGTVEELGYEEDGTVHAFADIFEGSSYSLLAKPIGALLKTSITGTEEIAFATVLVATIVSYIFLAFTFIALLIIFAILVRALMHILKKIITRTYFGHFIDKLLGGGLGLVLAALIIFGSLTVIKLLANSTYIIPVNNLIADSTIVKWLFNNNYLYTWLIESFKADTIINSLIAKISG